MQPQPTLTPTPSTLPITTHKPQILTQILKSQTTLICGQTGCGKTTQVPQYLYPHFRRIIVTQPRRISAIALAERVAREMGVVVGKEVGYSVRFEEKREPETRIVFMTDGMAIREIMAGGRFDVFVIDQAHQRSINTDVLMALLKDRITKSTTNTKTKPTNSPFKLVIMSATIESTKFLQFFNSSSLIRIPGRTFPTQIYNLLEPVQSYIEAVYNCVLQIHEKEGEGDVLVFLTGEEEIVGVGRRLERVVEEFGVANMEVLMLYSALPHQQQHKIFTPHPPETRRIILSTNIAQTSITIPNLKYIVDPGFMKIRVYDSLKNIDMLSVVPISKANALQRAGRAGREGEGKCFRLYVKGDYEGLGDRIQPEILRCQLSGPVLQLKAIGIPKIRDLQFMDQPSQHTLTTCLTLLKSLNCLTESQQITPYGLEVSKIPLPPYLSNLLIQSYECGCHFVMLNVLSILSIDNLFYVGKEGREGRDKTNAVLEVLNKYMPVLGGGIFVYSDHLAKANILQEYIASNNKKSFCKGNFINSNNIKRAVMIRDQLTDYLTQIIQTRKKTQFHSIVKPPTTTHPLQTMHSSKKPKLTPQTISTWLACMQKNSPNNIAKLNKQGGGYTIVSSGQVAFVHPDSLLFFVKERNRPEFVVFYQVVRTGRVYLRDVTGVDG